MFNEIRDLRSSCATHWGLFELIFDLVLVLIVPIAPMSIFLRTARSVECFQRIFRSLLGFQKLKFIILFRDRRWFMARHTLFPPAWEFAIRLSSQLVKTLILALIRYIVTATSEAKSALLLDDLVQSISVFLNFLQLKFSSLFLGACCKSFHQYCCTFW